MGRKPATNLNQYLLEPVHRPRIRDSVSMFHGLPHRFPRHPRLEHWPLRFGLHWNWNWFCDCHHLRAFDPTHDQQPQTRPRDRQTAAGSDGLDGGNWLHSDPRGRVMVRLDQCAGLDSLATAPGFRYPLWLRQHQRVHLFQQLYDE